MATKKQEKAQKNTGLVQGTQIPRTRALAGNGIGSEERVDRALDAIFDDLADDRADFEKTRYMLSAIGKKLSMENMKIRAGFYKGDRATTSAKPGFFLSN